MGSLACGNTLDASYSERLPANSRIISSERVTESVEDLMLQVDEVGQTQEWTQNAETSKLRRTWR